MFERVALGVLNHLLQDATWARARLAPYAGRTVRFALPPLRVDLSIDLRGLFLVAPAVAEVANAPDVEVTLPSHWLLTAPMLAPLAMIADKPLLPEIHISGEPGMADTLRFVLGNLHWDYEEDLSVRFGDIAAHRVATAINALKAWQRKTAQDLAENGAEYLVYEQATLARPDEIDDFSIAVGDLRDEVASLERRITHLRKRT